MKKTPFIEKGSPRTRFMELRTLTLDSKVGRVFSNLSDLLSVQVEPDIFLGNIYQLLVDVHTHNLGWLVVLRNVDGDVTYN